MKDREALIRWLEMERLFGADVLPTSTPGGKTPATPAWIPARTAPPSESPPEPAVKASPEFEDFRERVLKCTRCRLHETRTQVVFGVGNVKSPVVFVGEAPGEDEDLRGEPFVGRAGQLLTRLLDKIGVPRRLVYIANILKCRPPANRVPQLDEIQSCIPHLLRQIQHISPKVVCAMGAVAARALMNNPKLAVMSFRGKYYDYNNMRVFVTVHPSYCLRNPGDTPLLEGDLRRVLADVGLSPGGGK